MKFRRVIALSTMAVMAAGMTLNVSAAPSSVNKYVNQLKKSGQIDLILDVEAYREAYSDLEEAFGDDRDAYIKHYLTTGVYERRFKGVLFDPLAYAEGYSDIKDAFGEDVFAAVTHYLNYGITENRTVGTAAGYEDIAAAVENGAVPVSGEIQETGEGHPANAAVPQAAVVQTADSQAAGGQTADSQAAGGSAQLDYWRTTSIYKDDGVTLWRVEYYDRDDRLIFYSEVTDYDSGTNSYTEKIYSKDMELVRTDTYVNGAVSAAR